MKTAPLILLFVTFSLAKSPNLQIRNGEEAQVGEFPYMVEIRDSNACLVCGGSIIGSKWILTSGHCIDETFLGESGGYQIIYGTTTLYDCHTESSTTDTIINVKTQYRHPTFSMNFITGIATNDIGLLELETDIPFDSNARPVTLAAEGVEPEEGVVGTLTGWGSPEVAQEPSATLQKIQLTVLPNEDCSAQIDQEVEGVMLRFNGTQWFCTNEQDNGQCSGDSGGPYVIDGVQYGVVAWSLKPCGSHPGVLNRIGFWEHRQWIQNVTGI